MALMTLREVSNELAKKQDGNMVDSLTESALFLNHVLWNAASHKMWNVAEELSDIQGAGFVPMNAPLPLASVTSNIVKVDLEVLGARIEVPEDTADQFGGAANYFAKRQDKIIAKAGEDAERRLFYNNWTAFGYDNKKLINAGSTAGGTSSIICVTFDEDGMAGLYDETQFANGDLLTIKPISGGNVYTLDSTHFAAGTLGYGVRLLGRFGFQCLNPKYISGIVNINADNLPTPTMIDNMIDDAHVKPGKTFIFCHQKTKSLAINPHKKDYVQDSKTKDMDTIVQSWSGIPIIADYVPYHLGETVMEF